VQDVRKLQNKDLRADLAWCINSRKIESRQGDFPSLRELRVAVSSSGIKGRERFFPQMLAPSIYRIAPCFFVQ